MPPKPKYSRDNPGRLKCPNFDYCGYSHDEDNRITRHLRGCEPQLPDPQRKRSRSSPSSYLLDHFPVSVADVRNYEHAVLKHSKPFAATFVNSVVNFYGNKKAPASLVENFEDFEAYVDGLQRIRGTEDAELHDKTKGNYLKILQHALGTIGLRYGLDLGAHTSYLAAICSKTFTAATQRAIRSNALVVFNPLEFARLYHHLRGRWVRLIPDFVRHCGGMIEGDNVSRADLVLGERVMCFVMAGILLFHPAQRIEVLQSLGIIPDGVTHEALMQETSRTLRSRQKRSLLRLGDTPYAVALLTLDDKSKSPGFAITLLPVVSAFVSVWLRLRYKYKLWGSPSNEFVFPHQTKPGIDRTISGRLLLFFRENLEFPESLRLHDIRKLCIAAMALEWKGDAQKLHNLAVSMRHTLGVANTYYNHTLVWIESLKAQQDMHSAFGEEVYLDAMWPQVPHRVSMPAPTEEVEQMLATFGFGEQPSAQPAEAPTIVSPLPERSDDPEQGDEELSDGDWQLAFSAIEQDSD